MRNNYSSVVVWEEQVGYSRAVKVGNIIKVSGTTATEGSSIIGDGDMYKQAAFILQKIIRVLNEAGASAKYIVRTRKFVTDISAWQPDAKAHHEVFKNIKPVTTIVQVAALIDKNF
ncbi:RidA family protein [soil metagenome]